MKATPTLKVQFDYYDLKMSSANINTPTIKLKLPEASFLFHIFNNYYLAAVRVFICLPFVTITRSSFKK